MTDYIKCEWSEDNQDDCPYCSGEACNQCYGVDYCSHDVTERHQFSEPDVKCYNTLDDALSDFKNLLNKQEIVIREGQYSGTFKYMWTDLDDAMLYNEKITLQFKFDARDGLWKYLPEMLAPQKTKFSLRKFLGLS